MTACLISDTSNCENKNNVLNEESSESESECSDQESDEAETGSEPEFEDDETICTEEDEEEAKSLARLHGKQEGEEKLVNMLNVDARVGLTCYF